MQKTDYNRLFKNHDKSGKLLLHVCCAPCSSSVLPRLNGFDIIAYYYNPNIDTKEEYDLRAAQFEKLGINPVKEVYDHNQFLNVAAGYEDLPEGEERCRRCISLRLNATAIKAKQLNIPLFCSTLSVSPHKDADFINAEGQRLSELYGVEFLPNDFKKENGFLQSTIISKERGIYRQNYCGCEFGRAYIKK